MVKILYDLNSFILLFNKTPTHKGAYFKMTMCWEMSVNSELSEILLQAEADCSLERSITIITDINRSNDRLQFWGPTAFFQPLRLRSDIEVYTLAGVRADVFKSSVRLSETH